MEPFKVGRKHKCYTCGEYAPMEYLVVKQKRGNKNNYYVWLCNPCAKKAGAHKGKIYRTDAARPKLSKEKKDEVSGL